MATIIDSLVVSLGLDPKDMASKAPAAVKNLEAIENKGNAASKSIEGLAKSFGALLALIGGTVAIKAFITDFITVNAQLDRLSQNLNLSVSTISAWSNATERLGGSAQGLQGTLDMLSKSQTELMLTGQSALIPYFSALGVSLADAGGKARPLDDILLDLSDRFSKMDRTTANNMGRMMGVDQGTMNLLLQGRKELELTIQRQKEHNAVTKAQAEQASKFQKSLADTKESLAALGRALLMDAAPALEKLFGLFQEFASWIQGHEEFIADFLKVIAVGLAAVALAASPITLTTAAVVALAAGIALLWQDYQTWKRGGDSLIDWGKWEPGIEAAIHGIERLRTAFFFVKQGAKEIADIATGNWAGLVAHASENPPSNSDIENSGAAKSARGIFQRDSSSVTAIKARGLAATVSTLTGVPADIIYADWQHETGNFTNRGSRELNNFAGINVPGGKGEDYKKFDSPLDFAIAYAKLIGKYKGIGGVKSGEQFASVLKANNYYSDTESNYASGINGFLKQDGSSYAASLLGIPGASRAAAGAGGAGSGAGSVDRSTETHIGEIKIYTAATDAKGIASDMGSSLDYLFASQANAGLN